MLRVDLTGQRYGRLTVIAAAETRNRVLWLCRCDCGTEKTVQANNLRSGTTKSCGCFRAEVLKVQQYAPKRRSGWTLAEASRRFWSMVEKTPGCWLWTGPRGENGYGIFNWCEGKSFPAHRVSYALHRGRVPGAGLMVIHAPIICHNRACVNPDHLREGTAKDNAADAKLDREFISRRGTIETVEASRVFGAEPEP